MKREYTVYTIEYHGKITYVGKTCDFNRRINEHLSKKANSALPDYVMLDDVNICAVAVFDNEYDALKYEDKLIHGYGTIENGWNKKYNNIKKPTNPLHRRSVPISYILTNPF